MEASRAFTILLLLLLKSILLFGQQGMWTWMKGDSTPGSPGHFGTQGVPDSANTPPGFYEANGWTDLEGNFWLYGGGSSYSDLWKYNVSTNMWTWIRGPGIPNQPAVYGTQGIPSVLTNPGGRGLGFVTWVDVQGDLWLFGGCSISDQKNDLWRYHIATNEWTWMKGPQTGYDLGHYGTITMPAPANNPPARSEVRCGWTENNGNLWLFGGLRSGNLLNDLWSYDVNTNLWTWMHGSSTPNHPAVYGVQCVPSMQNTPGARMAYAHLKDADGNFWLFGGEANNGLFSDLWKFDPQILEWTWISGSNLMYQPGVCIGICNSSADNIPGNRFENSAGWLGSCDQFFLYGGLGNNGGTTYISYGDLWFFNRFTNEWTFIKGSLNPNITGHHGTITVPAPANLPRALYGSVSWTDLNGNLWLFGGGSLVGQINELWRFTPDSLCPQGNSLLSSGISNDTCLSLGDSIMISATGGTYYQWTPTTNISNPSIPNPIVYPDSTTTYSVYISDGSCHVTLSVNITINTISLFNLLNQDTIICQGDSIAFHATGGNMYQWTPLSNISNPNVPNPIVYPDSSTIYSVSISNGACQATFPVSVFVSTDSSFNLTTHDTIICSGDSISLHAIGGNIYQWIPLSNINNPNIPDPVVYPDNSTLYSVLISNGPCQSTFQVFIAVNSDSSFQIITPDTIICKGDSVTLQAIGGNSYQWQPNYNLSNPNIPNPVAFPDTSTIYTVTIENDCFSHTYPIYIQVIQNTTKRILNNDTTLCPGQALQVHATGGNQYWWNSGQNDSIITVNPLAPAQYIVTITDAYGCHTSDSVMITIYNLPVLQITPSEPAICLGSSVQLKASGAINYQWTPQQWLSSYTGNSVIATPPQTITYTVTGTDQNSCTNTTQITVNVMSLPVSLLPDTDYLCHQTSMILEAGYDLSWDYTWQDGSTGPHYTVNNPGTYWVTIKNTPCSLTDTIVILPCTELWVPNAFTPDGDNINDMFLAFASTELKSFQMQIFNRWGEQIFESGNIFVGWDGSYKGKECPQDLYVWVIQYETIKPLKQNKLRGKVTLLR